MLPPACVKHPCGLCKAPLLLDRACQPGWVLDTLACCMAGVLLHGRACSLLPVQSGAAACCPCRHGGIACNHALAFLHVACRARRGSAGCGCALYQFHALPGRLSHSCTPLHIGATQPTHTQSSFVLSPPEIYAEIVQTGVPPRAGAKSLHPCCS